MVEDKKITIIYKTVDDILIAYIRFLGQYEEIPAYFDRLQVAAGTAIAGNPLCLYDRTADDVPGAHYIEVCYPVSQPMERGDVKSKTLGGVRVMAAVYPLARNAPWEPAAWWQDLVAYVRAHYMTIDEDPLREIRYIEDGVEMSEIQLVLQFPRWLEGLSQGLKAYAGEEIQQQVMAGAADLEPVAPIEARLTWIQQAMQKLDQAVPDPETRGRLVHGCAHRYPQVRIEKMQALYKKLGSIDALIAWIQEDKIAQGGASWYGDPVRDGNIIYDVKGPPLPKEYEQAKTNLEKRVARCYCPIVRAAIRMNRPLSATFCNCSAGYVAQFWEAILGQPLHIEVVESVLKGDEVCKLAIHLPDKAII